MTIWNEKWEGKMAISWLKLEVAIHITRWKKWGYSKKKSAHWDNYSMIFIITRNKCRPIDRHWCQSNYSWPNAREQTTSERRMCIFSLSAIPGKPCVQWYFSFSFFFSSIFLYWSSLIIYSCAGKPNDL